MTSHTHRLRVTRWCTRDTFYPPTKVEFAVHSAYLYDGEVEGGVLPNRFSECNERAQADLLLHQVGFDVRHHCEEHERVHSPPVHARSHLGLEEAQGGREELAARLDHHSVVLVEQSHLQPCEASRGSQVGGG